MLFPTVNTLRKLLLNSIEIIVKLKGYKNTHLLTLEKGVKLYDLEKEKLQRLKKLLK
jgi:hypothetical protein